MGSLWQTDADHQDRATQIVQFLTDFLQSGFMNMLSQYGVGGGAGNAGTFVDSNFVPEVPTMLTQATIQQNLQALIDAGSLPEPVTGANVTVVVYLDNNTSAEDRSDPANPIVVCEAQNDNAFGYHSFFMTTAGNPLPYAIIPALTDACLASSCADDAHCSLQTTQTQLARQTQVTSHEFAEMTTDPLLNAWFDPDPDAGENGDICNGQSDQITVGANTWTVQRIYSKQGDLSSNGASFCSS